MNQKGFAISGMLYTILIIFLVLLFGILGILGSRKVIFDKTKKEIQNELNDIAAFDYVKSFGYTGDVQTFVVPKDGMYQVELWGASGGMHLLETNTVAGRGAYTKGTIALSKNATFYVYVGEQGQIGKYGINNPPSLGLGGTATFNGGGSGGKAGGGEYPYQNYIGGPSGGGSTDIRLLSGIWDNFDSLKSRIMVAGGGAGSSNSEFKNHENSGEAKQLIYNGGNAGGLQGYLGTTIGVFKSEDYLLKAGKQGEKNTGFSFGKGGSGDNSGIPGACNGHSGGGGGYYGGFGGKETSGNCFIIGGGGGSSFISGYPGCDAITEASTSANIVHTGQPNHYSGKVFDQAIMKSGNELIPNPSGGGETVGNTGNGYARITFLHN